MRIYHILKGTWSKHELGIINTGARMYGENGIIQINPFFLLGFQVSVIEILKPTRWCRRCYAHKSGSWWNGEGQLPNKANLDKRITLRSPAPAHPTRIQSVPRSPEMHGTWPFADGASRENFSEIWCRDSISKNVMRLDVTGLGAVGAWSRWKWQGSGVHLIRHGVWIRDSV